MRLLLDTHALLWWLADDPRLSPEARAAVADGDAQVAVSAASAWEIAIKSAHGKLEAPSAFAPHHDEPFDRMLVAQAQLEGLTVVTRDPAFRAYGVPLLAA